MKRAAQVSTPGKKRKVEAKKTSKKSFYAVPRPLTQYKTGFPKQLAITHKYSAGHQLNWISPNANVEYFPMGLTASMILTCLQEEPNPLLRSVGSHLQPLHRDESTDQGNHRAES